MGEQWRDTVYLMEGEERVHILSRLVEGPCTPSELALELDVPFYNIGRVLQGLIERALVHNVKMGVEKKLVYMISLDGAQALAYYRELTKDTVGRRRRRVKKKDAEGE